MKVNHLQAQRFVIVGTSGSGKTSLAKRVSAILQVPHIELDAINWLSDWTERDHGEFRVEVEKALQVPGWVVDGNYRRVKDVVWTKAEIVVWLDYSLLVVLRRLVQRTIRRGIKREVLWSGNRESLRMAFFSKDSILLWALQTHATNQRRYIELCADPSYSHVTFVRLKTPAATEQWVKQLAEQANYSKSPAQRD